MEYAIGADPEFLRVLVEGRDTDVPPSALCAQVLAESERLERPRILIELNQKFPLSLASQQQLIEALPKIGFSAEHSIALVHRTPIAQMANSTSTCSPRGASLPYATFATSSRRRSGCGRADARPYAAATGEGWYGRPPTAPASHRRSNASRGSGLLQR